MKLKKYREAAGLTQRQVAERVGIAVQNYQRYEYGVTIPNAVIAVNIARALNTTVEALYDG